MTPEQLPEPIEAKRRGRPRGIGRAPRPVPPRSTPSSIARRATPEGRRRAVAILSVLSGEMKPGDAASSLGITLPRYYALEVDAYQGMVQALEPKPLGYQRSPEREAERLAKECLRLGREVGRLKALLRTAQRLAGVLAAVPAREEGKKEGKGKVRRPTVRALRLKKALETPQDSGPPAGGSLSNPPLGDVHG